MLATQPRVAEAFSGGSLQNVRNRLITSIELKEMMITENIWEQQYEIKVSFMRKVKED
jgi:fumarylacetoacetate (FAA) hydrolase family protein